MRRRPYGPEAWLVEELDDPIEWALGLQAADLAGVVEVVPSERSVLVRCERAALQRIGVELGEIEPVARDADPEPVVIPVRYTGEDLAEVASRAGLSIRSVIDRHRGGVYRVRFCGFAPGFAYLGGLDPALHLPRRDEPRTRVPAGSVAVAAHYTAVYPSASPGGWHLIGHTDRALWDDSRAVPTLLVPGATVRFEAVGS